IEYIENFCNPYVAAQRGYIDDVIKPRETRKRIYEALEMLKNKEEFSPKRKHGNMPV
ncbi:MAG: carboxyl transferase domain-containing protein, partial [Nitrososphaerota archaeon]